MSRATMGNLLFGPGAAPTRRQFKPRTPLAPTWRKLEPGAVLLAIDPSIANAGWAIVRHGRRPELVDSGTWHPIETDERSRFDHLALMVAQRIRLSREAGSVITDALIETARGGGQGGEMMIRYARSIGVCEATCYRAGLRVHRVDVTSWKGSGKKSHTALVVRATFPKCEARENNQVDAIGLGIWLTSQR